ncbi:MAG: hypothetical protein FJY92_10720, partial [Candidatus Hydrogenedentes bacterium]|nr:hypothetical protein [Candidatus Hydrogenedentota bacterium]
MGAIVAGARADDATPGLRIEAENARVRSVGAQLQSIWNLWSDGELGDYVDVSANAALEVRVRAYGSPAVGEWPRMGIAVDDAAIGSTLVKSAEPGIYAFSLTASKGIHKIAVTFDNDLVKGNEDRNLYIDWIEIGPDAALGDPAAWARTADADTAAADTAALNDAHAAIETVRKGGVTLRVVDAGGAPVANAPIAVELNRHAFLFGCNIYGFDAFRSAAENAAYKKRFEELFNYATTGFYWRSYEPVRGQPQYAKTDAVVAWCAALGIRVKGHPLLWDHEASRPAWAGGQPAADVQEARVREIVARYKGKIEFWEVVNEPAHARGVTIDAPYRWARETDPAAHLIVNDYRVMDNGFAPFFDLLQDAIAHDVPFDGIGIQAHEPRTMRFPLARVKAVLDRYAALGKTLHITEFTPTSAGARITGSHVKGVWDEQAQAEYAEQFYTVCFAHPAVAAITWWDL